MKLWVVAASLISLCAGHGAMLNPMPRSSHSQSWDSRNKCGSRDPYSTAHNTGMRPGEYCGLGCLGDACLYYQIGCFHNCGNCSLTGKTLYPVPSDVMCDINTLPEPTLGGGNKTLEYELRTHNIDGDSTAGDWTKWMPWRSPGTAGRGNPEFSPCGINSGATGGFLPPTTAKDVPPSASGTQLPPLPKSEWATWKAGSVVEAEWAIYANHAGGYSYRLCKRSPFKELTEECYQQTPLKFATPETEIRYQDGSKAPFNVTSPTTDIGTWPKGSQWRKNPVPMCNCDIGLGCGHKDESELSETVKAERRMAMFHDAVAGKTCTAVTQDKCGTDYDDSCLKCGSGTTYDCEQCCPSCTPVTKTISGQSYTWCQCGKGPAPGPSPKPGHNNMFEPYAHTHFRPGQRNELCPTGVQFPTLWDGGAGAGTPTGAFGTFTFTMVDRLQVPDVPPGEYSVSWRWDCEETPQVWNSCADIIIN